MKGIIIAAGYGTRFLPCSKSIPKEMFPLIDTPAIDFIIEEFANSGIKDILIVTSRRKKALEDYFDREIELESFFKEKSDLEKIKVIKPKDLNIFFIRQKEMLGTGHAILICKEFIKDEPFVIAYPDDIVFSKIPLAKQLINIYKKTNGSVIAGEVINGDLSRYGVINYLKENDLFKVKQIIEKPKPGTEPSNMISVGRYLFTPDFLPILEDDYNKHSKGEFYHIETMNKLAEENKLFASLFDGERLDIGDKIGYLEGIIKYSLSRADLRKEAKNLIKKYIDY